MLAAWEIFEEIHVNVTVQRYNEGSTSTGIITGYSPMTLST